MKAKQNEAKAVIQPGRYNCEALRVLCELPQSWQCDNLHMHLTTALAANTSVAGPDENTQQTAEMPQKKLTSLIMFLLY